jgi:Domain of unknown function (DUF4153)
MCYLLSNISFMNRLRLFFSQWILALDTFPLSFVILATMSVVWVMMIYGEYDSADYLFKIMMSCLVALPLTMLSPLQTYISQGALSYKNLIFSALWVGVGALYYATLPDVFNNNGYIAHLLSVWSIVLCRLMLLFVIAWKKQNNEIGTRVWWRELLSAILMWFVAWGIIWWWISACLVSLEYLFWVVVNSHMYWYVGVVSMIFIAGAIALIHIVNQNTTDQTPLYSRTMRIFGHYIFLPLTILYGCILISYGIKILLTWVRPKGRVVYMVIWYVWFWILTRLATYPALPNWFISKAHRGLFISFLLTSFLMIQAVRMRISQYWFTIDRYFVCAIIAWIIIASIGSIIFTKRRYMIMITTLLVLWSISLYAGRYSAAWVASISQKDMLIKTLWQYNLTLPLWSWSLSNGAVASGDANKIYSTISYIVDLWDKETIASLIPASERTVLDSKDRYLKNDYILNYIWLNYANSGMFDPTTKPPQQLYFSMDQGSKNTNDTGPISIQWYSQLYPLRQSWRNMNIISVWKEKTVDLSVYAPDMFSIARAVTNGLSIPTPVKNNISYEKWTIAIVGDTWKIVLTHVYGYKGSQTWDVYVIENYNGYVLVK